MFWGMERRMGLGPSPTPSGGGDGLIGWYGADAGSSGYGNISHFYSLFTTQTPGTINYIHTKVYSVHYTNYVNVAIYNSSKVKLAQGTKIIGDLGEPQKMDFTLNTPITLVAATTYYLCLFSNSVEFGIGRNAATGIDFYYHNGQEDPAWVDTMPDPLPDGDIYGTDMTAWIYADNTATQP